MEYEPFGQRVRALRRARRWSQERVAELANLDQTTVSKVENATVIPTLATVRALATAFGVDELTFVQQAGLLPDTPPEEPAAAGASLSMPLDVETVIRFVESRPGADYQARLARLRTLLPEDQYRQLLIRVFAAWEANSALALDAFGLGH